MPEILVVTRGTDGADEAVLLRELVHLSDFESAHFCGQLVERVGWAVVDADEVEERTTNRRHPASLRSVDEPVRPGGSRPGLRRAA